MKKLYILTLVLAVLIIISPAGAQTAPVITATLHYDTPVGQAVGSGQQGVDMARITLTADEGDVFIDGFYLESDSPGGLNNFTNVFIYDVTNSSTLVATYPQGSANFNLVEVTPITIGNGLSKTYLLRGSFTSGASGAIRLGLGGLSYATQAVPTDEGFPVFGNYFVLPGSNYATPTPTPSGSPVLTVSPSASPTPGITVVPRPFNQAEVASLKDGDIVRADGRSAVFVIKIVGTKRFKRWMISPAVLGAYGIPFSRIRLVEQATVDQFSDSHLMRRFGDEKVYELWDVVEGMTGSRRWIPTVTDFLGRGFDFDAVYTINDGEHNLYTEGQVLKAPTR